MNEKAILEAIAEVLMPYGLEDVNKEILTAIKPLLPPSDLVKVWEGRAHSLAPFYSGERNPWAWTSRDKEGRVKEKDIQVYIREVKS